MGDRYEDEGPQGGGGSGGKVVLIVVAVLVCMCLVGMVVMGIVAAITMPALVKAKEKANQSKCASHLRQLALGSVMYAQDNRFFPHVRGLRELDGGAETSDAPRSARALINASYMDSPETLICPSSFDLHYPPTEVSVVEDPRAWFWEGSSRPDPSANSFVDGLDDPTLISTEELSYGWTRKPLNRNAPSSQAILADRSQRLDENQFGPPGAIGNHVTGYNVAYADAAVTFREPSMDATLVDTLTSETEGALGLVPQEELRGR